MFLSLRMASRNALRSLRLIDFASLKICFLFLSLRLCLIDLFFLRALRRRLAIFLTSRLVSTPSRYSTINWSVLSSNSISRCLAFHAPNSDAVPTCAFFSTSWRLAA